jgi:hypothetical protein
MYIVMLVHSVWNAEKQRLEINIFIYLFGKTAAKRDNRRHPNKIETSSQIVKRIIIYNNICIYTYYNKEISVVE